MSNYVLDKSYRIVTEGGVNAGRAVVRTGIEGECALPATASAAGVLGIATHAQTREDRYVAVRRLGIAQAVAAGAIDAGAPVCVADDTGRIMQAPPPTFLFGNVGANSAVQLEWTDRQGYSYATAIRLANLDENQEFDWNFNGSTLQVFLTTNGSGQVTMTAAQLIAAINGDAGLSRFLRASNQTGSNGTGVVSDQAFNAQLHFTDPQIIGIAEQEAAEAGDIIDVLLTPR